MFETKISLVKPHSFTACFISGTTNRQKFGGEGSGGIPSKIFFSGFARTGKTAQNKSQEATCFRGGATAQKLDVIEKM